MPFLPVVERELRVASRRLNTYWTRCIAGLVAIVICGWVFFAFKASGVELSKALFYSISACALIYALLSGVHITADCLSEEKREGTLGLLFLTDLKGYDVVLGKLAATSLNALYSLMAIFPVLAIPLLLGGLTAGEFGRMILVLLNSLFFSLCAGIVISAWSTNDRKAMSGTFLLILFFAMILPMLGAYLAFRYAVQVHPAFVIPSPAHAYSFVFDLRYRTAPQQFWMSLAVNHALSWFFLAVASYRVPRSWQDTPENTKKVRWRQRWVQWKFGSAELRKNTRGAMLEVNPFFWLAGRNQLKITSVYGTLLLLGIAWFWLWWKNPREMMDPGAFIATAMLLHLLLKFWVAAESCRQLGEDRRSGALELLLSTPLSVSEILRGQLLALRRQFGGAILLVLAADFAMLAAGMRHQFASSMSRDWFLNFGAGIVLLLVELYAIAWVGMWLGLNSRKTNAASGGAIFRVIVVPWILIFIAISAVTLGNVRFINRSPEVFFFSTLFLIRLLNAIFFFSWARTQLHAHLRTVVASRFEARGPRRWFFSSRERAPGPAGTPAQA